MRWAATRGVRYLQFPALAEVSGVWHAIFTRWASDGEGRRLPLNIGMNNGDPRGGITANRRRMLAAAGGHTAVFARQVHGIDVAVFDPSAHAAPPAPQQWTALDGDALITATTGVALLIQTADCQSVLLADPERRVVANVHSGWRGSIRNIVGRTVQTMINRFDCRPERLIGAVGPSLGPCCAEFIHYRREIPEAYWPYRLPGNHFDFWRITVDQLAAAGVPPDQVSVSDLCTRCNPGLFFSHRGEGADTGRFAAVIRLAD